MQRPPRHASPRMHHAAVSGRLTAAQARFEPLFLASDRVSESGLDEQLGRQRAGSQQHDVDLVAVDEYHERRAPVPGFEGAYEEPVLVDAELARDSAMQPVFLNFDRCPIQQP